MTVRMRLVPASVKLFLAALAASTTLASVAFAPPPPPEHPQVHNAKGKFNDPLNHYECQFPMPASDFQGPDANQPAGGDYAGSDNLAAGYLTELCYYRNALPVPVYQTTNHPPYSMCTFSYGDDPFDLMPDPVTVGPMSEENCNWNDMCGQCGDPTGPITFMPRKSHFLAVGAKVQGVSKHPLAWQGGKMIRDGKVHSFIHNGRKVVSVGDAR